jgi:phosphatidylserine decarboxylase
MRIDPAGWPFIGGAFLIGLLTTLWAGPRYGALFFLLSGLFLIFFRDPDRPITQAARAVLSPADGRVIIAGAPTGQLVPSGTWQQISIFLSPTDVHVNRMPVAGRVTKVEYHPGRFLPAYKAEAGDLNEYTEVTVQHDGQTVVIRQIVGILARRIVCRIKAGDTVRAGDRFGVMKFGSRMDVFVPGDATMCVKVGQQVTGGVTVIAQLAPTAPAVPSST